MAGITRGASRLVGITFVALCFCLLTVLLAKAAPAQDSNFDLEGSISEHEPGKLTIDTGGGIIFHATYAADTPIVHADGKPAAEKDLKTGVKVHILGDLQQNGEVKSQKIEIEDGQSKS